MGESSSNLIHGPPLKIISNRWSRALDRMLHMLSCPKLSRLTGNKLDTWRNVGRVNYGQHKPPSDITDIMCDPSLRCTGPCLMSAGLRRPGHLTKKVLSPTKKCWHSKEPWNKCFRKQFSDTRKCNAIYIYCAIKFLFSAFQNIYLRRQSWFSGWMLLPDPPLSWLN